MKLTVMGVGGSRAGPIFLFLCMIVVLYSQPLFSRRSFAGRDLLAYHLPVESAIHDAYARGRLPVWYSEISGGRPLLANPNTGSLYPVRPLLALLPFPLAFRIYPILHWMIAAAGMAFLLGSLGGSRESSWIAAVTYAFSGVGVSEVFYTNLQPGMALLPWILWGTVARFSTREGQVLVLAILWSLDLLAGDVFSLLIALGSCLLWIGLECEAGSRSRRIATLAGAAFFGALLAAPQWVATALWAPLTQRAVVGLRLGEVFTFSLSPWRLLELVIPYPFGATWSLDREAIWGSVSFRNYFATLYCGILPLFGFAAAVSGKVRGFRFVRSVAVGSILLASLPSLLPAAWRDAASPIPLRYPEKFVLGLVFAMSVAAGLAWDGLRGENRQRLLSGMLPIGLLLGLLAVLAAIRPLWVGRFAASAVGAPASVAQNAGRHLAVALAEAGLLWMFSLVALEISGRQRWRWASVLLLTLVPIAANRKIARTERQEVLFAPTPLARAAERRDPQRLYRGLDESLYRPFSALERASLSVDFDRADYYRRHLYLYTQALWKQGTVFNSDLDAGDLSRIESLRRLTSFIADQDSGRVLFETLSLRFGARLRDQQPILGFREFGGDSLQAWDENPSARPSVRLLSRWREVSGSLQALESLSVLRSGEVAIETGNQRSGTSLEGSVRILENSPERLRVATQGERDSWLFVLRGYWPYRRVTLDGRDVEIFPAGLAFCAIAVPSGAHRIDWSEEIPGIGISLFGPLAFLGLGSWLLLRHRGKLRQGQAGRTAK